MKYMMEPGNDTPWSGRGDFTVIYTTQHEVHDGTGGTIRPGAAEETSL
jgi:hypothetical protein